LESLDGVAVARELRREELDGDVPVQAHVFGKIHDAHPAAAELLEDPIVRNDAPSGLHHSDGSNVDYFDAV